MGTAEVTPCTTGGRRPFDLRARCHGPANGWGCLCCWGFRGRPWGESMGGRHYGRDPLRDGGGRAGRHRAPHVGQHRAPADVQPEAVVVRERVVPALWGASGSLAAAALATILFTGQLEPGKLLALPPYVFGPSEDGPENPAGAGPRAPDVREVGRQFPPVPAGWATVGVPGRPCCGRAPLARRRPCATG